MSDHFIDPARLTNPIKRLSPAFAAACSVLNLTSCALSARSHPHGWWIALSMANGAMAIICARQAWSSYAARKSTSQG